MEPERKDWVAFDASLGLEYLSIATGSPVEVRALAQESTVSAVTEV